MNTKNLVLMALLVGVGTALYLIIPGYGGGMKPDFMLTMMFIGILLFPTVKETFLLSVTTGILSGLFSSMPGSFVPNMIDKVITGFVIFLVVVALRKFAKNIAVGAIIVIVGTLISGSVFLYAMTIIASLPDAFGALFIAVVLPATVLNTVAFVIIYPIILGLLKRSNYSTTVSHS